jgi:MerR family transcriptional regulator, copper efflux regulator
MSEMTIGEVSRRTGLAPKAIREYETKGLIYSLGRSEGNYRLFDESALWCARVITGLRAVGLTVKEIEGLAAVYLERPGEPIGPHLAPLLGRAEQRIGDRICELEGIRSRIKHFREQNRDALAGQPDADLALSDPRRHTSAA